MGAIWTLSIDGYEIGGGKYNVHPLVLTVFRDKERVRDESMESEDDFYDNTKYLYKAKCDHVIDRLELMGFTRKEAIARFDNSENGIQKSVLFDELQAHFDHPFAFDDWQSLVSEIIRLNIRPLIFPGDASTLPSGISDQIVTLCRIASFAEDLINMWGFPSCDYRYFLRVFLEHFDKDAEIILDYSEQIRGHYYEPEDKLVEDSIKWLSSGVAENAPILVLTEGPSDIEILKESLVGLRPHLAEYFYFLDLNLPLSSKRRIELGAKMLARQVESFMGAKIQNRIIAIFDNDIAGWSACGHLVNERLPSNIRVFPLPDLEFAANYPVEINGHVEMRDINRKGCSIELYLGQNLLLQSGHNSSTVSLKATDENWSLEEAAKTMIRRRYLSALQSRRHQKFRPHDWGGIERIVKLMITAFHS